MASMNFIFLFDISTILLMLVLAYLSKCLGGALKIKSFYKGLYVTAFLMATATCLDYSVRTFSLNLSLYIPMSIRLISSVTAFLICLKYWNWLFPEFIKKLRGRYLWRKKILVIEDDRDIADLVKLVLETTKRFRSPDSAGSAGGI